MERENRIKDKPYVILKRPIELRKICYQHQSHALWRLTYDAGLNLFKKRQRLMNRDPVNRTCEILPVFKKKS